MGGGSGGEGIDAGGLLGFQGRCNGKL